MQHDPSDLGILILILVIAKERTQISWHVETFRRGATGGHKKSKTGEIYQFQNRKSTFGSKVSRQRQHYIKEVLEFSVFNVILQHWQKPAPG